jgi:DNA repair protein RadD
VTHVKELLQQNCDEMLEQYPDANIGFYCASLGQKIMYRDITFASIQSIYKKAHLSNKAFDLIIIDEVHLVSHKDTTSYRKFIKDCKAINPLCRVIGLTGTPFRSDTGRLDEGENALFKKISYEIPMSFMIDEGYWVKPTTKNNKIIDASNVKTRGGDYIEKDLQALVNDPDKTKACVDEILLHGQTRNKVLIFTAGKKHAEDVYNEITSRGEKAEFITDETKNRDDIIERYKKGDFKYLINIAVLTTGFNVPSIDMLVFLRPMKSPVLYIQSTGRGVRTVYAHGHDLSTKEGRLEAIANSNKKDCFVLDLAGVVDNLGAIDELEIRKSYTGEKEKDGEGNAPFKICPSCSAECATVQKYCYDCGYSFLSQALNTTNTKAEIISFNQEPVEHDVIDVLYEIHEKKKTKDQSGFVPRSLKVTYITNVGTYSEFICFEHHCFEKDDKRRYAWSVACAWHKKRRPDIDPPLTIDGALQIDYPKPSSIVVKKEGKYWRVISYEFKELLQKCDIEKEFFEIPF